MSPQRTRGDTRHGARGGYRGTILQTVPISRTVSWTALLRAPRAVGARPSRVLTLIAKRLKIQTLPTLRRTRPPADRPRDWFAGGGRRLGSPRPPTTSDRGARDHDV